MSELRRCAWCKVELAAGYIGDVCEACLASAEPVSPERAHELNQLGVESLIRELAATHEQLRLETVARLAAEERALLAEHAAKIKRGDESVRKLVTMHLGEGAMGVEGEPGQVLTWADRWILHELGRHAYPDGLPSVAEIASWPRCSESSVRRFLKRMHVIAYRGRPL